MCSAIGDLLGLKSFFFTLANNFMISKQISNRRDELIKQRNDRMLSKREVPKGDEATRYIIVEINDATFCLL